MRYINLYLKDNLNIDQDILTSKNIAYAVNNAKEHVYMGLENDIKWIEDTYSDDIQLIRKGAIVLNATNNRTLVVGTKIYTGKWSKKIDDKTGKLYYTFNTKEYGNYPEHRIPYIGFKKVANNIEPGYTEITFTIAPTCPFYKEIKLKIKV